MGQIAKILILCVCLTGCMTARGSFCDVAKPLRFSKETIAAMSDAEVRDALAHNRKGAELCRWKP